jgi:hypothetical protein
VSASSPFAFYFAQILKVLFTVVPIGLILFASFIGKRSSRPLTWLRIVTAVWLVIALMSRSALSSSVVHHFISGRQPSYDAAREAHLYLQATFYLWTAEQVMFVVFSVALFFVLRSTLRSNPP